MKSKSDEYREIFSDYLVLLKLAYDSYEISEETRIINQLKKVMDSVREYITRQRLNKSVLNTVSLYIDNLKTGDESIIIPEGKSLVEILK